MRYALLLFILLALGGWGALSLGGGVPAAGGGGPGLTAHHQMDFEDSTPTTCVDGDAVTTCTLQGAPIPDCVVGDSDQCPLELFQSGRVNGNGRDFYYDGAHAFADGHVTLDFMFNADTLSNASGNPFMGMIDAFDSFSCVAQYASTTTVQALPETGSASATITMGEDNDYFARLVYDVDADDCTLSLSATEYGATDVGGPVTANGTSTTAVVDGWQATSSSNSRKTVVDAIKFCRGEATVEGICDS